MYDNIGYKSLSHFGNWSHPSQEPIPLSYSGERNWKNRIPLNRNIIRPQTLMAKGLWRSWSHRVDWFPFDWLIDWVFTVLRPAQEFSLIWRRHHCRWRAAKFRHMLGAQGLWAGRDLYRARPTVTRDLGFSGLIRRTAPFSRLLRHTRGCEGSILTWILTGSVPPR
jgi:hypothetical protein